MNILTYKERSKQRREQEILEQAGILMREHGFENFNMDKLAEAVGVSKPTLYQHFDSKDDLLAHVLLSGMEALEDMLIAPPQGTPIERLEMVLRFLLRKRYDADGVWANAGHDNVMTWMRNHPKLVEVRQRVAQRLVELVDEAKAQGEITDSVPTKLMVNSLFCMLGVLAKVYDTTFTGVELDHAIDHAVHLFLHGITAPPR
jgi:AcrR family transcriptional regulator